MSSSASKSGKKGWGSIWHGAVAGLESRLDTILAEEGSAASRQLATNARQNIPNTQQQTVQSKSSTSQTSELLRTSSESTSRQSPHLRPTTVSRSRSVTPDQAARDVTSLKPSDVDADHTTALQHDPDGNVKNSGAPESEQSEQSAEDKSSYDASSMDTPPNRIRTPDPQVSIQDTSGIVDGDTADSDGETIEESPAETRAHLQQAREAYENLELQRQEELHTNLERIDALQAKLQYLAQEAVASAKQAKSEAADDSQGKKLATKDEQIALLMEEGQKLSKAEVTQAATIRKLRSKLMEDGKTLNEAKRKLSKQDSIIADLSSKVSHVENSQKDSQAMTTRLSSLENDVTILRNERDQKDVANESLRKQLREAQSKAEDELRQSNAKAIEEERRSAQSLRDDLANMVIEKKLVEDRAKQELNASQEELQREQERNNASEIGLRNEISIMEGRLEVLRVRTEEVSTGNTNESQAKLLRQIETLQSQYAFASENWQGIESSLQSRLSAVEKERDDTIKQEAETRKKLRDSGNALRRLQEQYDESVRSYRIIESETNERKEDVERLQLRVTELEHQSKEAQASFERERQVWNSTFASRLEEEKAKWRQETPIESPLSRVDSPSVGLPRRPGLELPIPAPRRHMSRQPSADVGFLSLEKPSSRRSSYHPAKSPEPFSPNGPDSGRSTPFLNGNIPETPSLQTDADEGMETESSPQRTINDIMSASTAAAGPSVQLVERMSATVRRLESEKAANKEEMTRLSAQRDEARQEIVSLMSEIEQKRAVDAKVAKLEAEIDTISQRYQTTLEMLGEKSEKVDELEADVVELKNIYRELVENTIK